MGKFDGILILSDMDGTLTDNERLSDKNAQAIRYFCQNGGFFSVATGRQPWYIKSFAPRMVPNAPVVTLNGSVVYDLAKDRVIQKYPLPKKASEAVLYARKNYSEIDIICANMISDTIEWNKSCENDPDFDFENNEIMKILFVSFDKEFLVSLQKDLSQKFPDFIFLRSWANGLEMLRRGCGKGECIETIKKDMHITTVIGAGDYENDLSLIEMSDIGCAAKNSTPLLLKKADYISCDCSEDIIADIVAKLENGRLAG